MFRNNISVFSRVRTFVYGIVSTMYGTLKFTLSLFANNSLANLLNITVHFYSNFCPPKSWSSLTFHPSYKVHLFYHICVSSPGFDISYKSPFYLVRHSFLTVNARLFLSPFNQTSSYISTPKTSGRTSWTQIKPFGTS